MSQRLARSHNLMRAIVTGQEGDAGAWVAGSAAEVQVLYWSCVSGIVDQAAIAAVLEVHEHLCSLVHISGNPSRNCGPRRRESAEVAFECLLFGLCVSDGSVAD